MHRCPFRIFTQKLLNTKGGCTLFITDGKNLDCALYLCRYKIKSYLSSSIFVLTWVLMPKKVEVVKNIHSIDLNNWSKIITNFLGNRISPRSKNYDTIRKNWNSSGYPKKYMHFSLLGLNFSWRQNSVRS